MKIFWNYIKEKRAILIKVLVLSSISFLYLGRSLNGILPYPTGDGPEYVMTTEAIYNHFTPDVRSSDVKSFKESYCRENKWTDNYKYTFFDQLDAYFAVPDKKFMSEFGGIYTDKNDKNYGYHFFFYCALNAPGRYVAQLTNSNPLICFQVTNAVFVIITCFIILFFTPFSLWKTILAALAFCFSSAYWYLGWTHPEVYTVCLVTISFWFFLQNKNYLSIFLMALAGLQNQPLMIVLLFMAIKTIIDKGFNFKNIFKIGISSVIFLWPALFYYFHFGTTNLIKDAGFLSTDYITFTRVLGFYTDINQGVILVIPIALFLYVFFFIRKWVLVAIKKEAFDFNYLFPVFLLAMTCIVSTMGNWNHGQAIVNRYASWFSAIILIHVLFISSQFKKETASFVLLNYIFLSQTFTILYHEQFNVCDFSQDNHRPLARWFLEEHPSLYNPDPQIFIDRTNRNYDHGPDASPTFYIKEFNEITKFAVHKDRVDSLILFGFTKQEIERLKPTLSYINNWAYVNRGEFTCTKTGSEMYQIVRNRKIKLYEQRIRSHPEWVQQIEVKAKGWGISLDEAIKKDAEYLMTVEEKEY